MSTAAAKRHMGRIKQLPCGVCDQAGPSEAHHIRAGQGMSQRADDFLTIPLCIPCHRGPQGIHGDKTLWRIFKVDELTVLARTIERLTK